MFGDLGGFHLQFGCLNNRQAWCLSVFWSVVGGGWFVILFCFASKHFHVRSGYYLFHSVTFNMKLARFLSWAWWMVTYWMLTDSVPLCGVVLKVPFSLLYLYLQRLMPAYRGLQQISSKNKAIVSRFKYSPVVCPFFGNFVGFHQANPVDHCWLWSTSFVAQINGHFSMWACYSAWC